MDSRELRARVKRFAIRVVWATVLTGVIGVALQKIVEKTAFRGAPKAEIEQLFGRLDLIAPALLAAINGNGHGYDLAAKFLEIAVANATDPAIKARLEKVGWWLERAQPVVLGGQNRGGVRRLVLDRGSLADALVHVLAGKLAGPDLTESDLVAVASAALADDPEIITAAATDLTASVARDPAYRDAVNRAGVGAGSASTGSATDGKP